MTLLVRKVGERRGDTSRYSIDGLGEMWAFRALRVLTKHGEGMSVMAALSELDKADLEYDVECDRCDWV